MKKFNYYMEIVRTDSYNLNDFEYYDEGIKDVWEKIKNSNFFQKIKTFNFEEISMGTVILATILMLFTAQFKNAINIENEKNFKEMVELIEKNDEKTQENLFIIIKPEILIKNLKDLIPGDPKNKKEIPVSKIEQAKSIIFLMKLNNEIPQQSELLKIAIEDIFLPYEGVTRNLDESPKKTSLYFSENSIEEMKTAIKNKNLEEIKKLNNQEFKYDNFFNFFKKINLEIENKSPILETVVAEIIQKSGRKLKIKYQNKIDFTLFTEKQKEPIRKAIKNNDIKTIEKINDEYLNNITFNENFNYQKLRRRYL